MKINAINKINYKAVYRTSDINFSLQQQEIINEIKNKMNEKSKKQPEKTYNQILEDRNQGLLVEKGDANDSIKVSIINLKGSKSYTVDYMSSDNFRKNQFKPQETFENYNQFKKNETFRSAKIAAFVAAMITMGILNMQKPDDKIIIQSEQGDTFEKATKDTTFVLRPEDFEKNINIDEQ